MTKKQKALVEKNKSIKFKSYKINGIYEKRIMCIETCEHCGVTRAFHELGCKLEQSPCPIHPGFAIECDCDAEIS